jgi:hypothetical protein
LFKCPHVWITQQDGDSKKNDEHYDQKGHVKMEIEGTIRMKKDRSQELAECLSLGMMEFKTPELR